MTRLQRLLCLALGVLAAGAVVAAVLVHAQAERGRAALAAADRAHLAWFDARTEEAAARSRLRDLTARQAQLATATELAQRRLVAALEQARHARRPVRHATPRVIHRVRIVRITAGPG